MTYFSHIPLTTYEFNGETYVVKDITKRSKFVTELKPYTGLYSLYEIRDGDTFQSIALSIYGSSSLHWVILLFNEIHDPNFEWPLDQISLSNYATQKYGDCVNSVKHWEKDGVVIGESIDFVSCDVWVSPLNPEPNNILCLPKTFFEYEADLNEERRLIKILHPELLSDFIQQFSNSFNE